MLPRDAGRGWQRAVAMVVRGDARLALLVGRMGDPGARSGPFIARQLVSDCRWPRACACVRSLRDVSLATRSLLNRYEGSVLYYAYNVEHA